MKKLIIAAAILMASFSQAFSAQHDYNLSNNPGVTFRGDLNNALQAIATNNSGATAPATTFANMWWFDTSTSILKQRDNANTSWINVAYKSESGWMPYRQGTQLGDVSILSKDTDGTLASNSDALLATQKAVKTYADTKISKATSGEISAMTEKTALSDNDLFIIEDSESSNAKKKVKKSNIASNAARNQLYTTATTTNWTAPTGVTNVFVTMCAGGGGGGSSAESKGAGGGGAGACIISKPQTVVPGNSYTVTVGSGGSAGSGGGDTSFGSLSAPGGGGGSQSAAGTGGGKSLTGLSGASGAAGGGGNIMGGSGGIGYDSGSYSVGGGGGGTYWGSGAGGGNNNNGGSASANTGAAGGGAGGAHSGGSGGSGFVLVEW